MRKKHILGILSLASVFALTSCGIGYSAIENNGTIYPTNAVSGNTNSNESSGKNLLFPYHKTLKLNIVSNIIKKTMVNEIILSLLILS